MLPKLNQFKKASVAVMPDFFVDRIIKMNSKEELIDKLYEEAKFGGGSIRNIPTIEVKGGNAVNVAYCIAMLGFKVTSFTVADQFGSAILKHIFSEFSNNVDLRITPGKQGYTTAHEFLTSRFNVMLADIGDST